MFALLDVGDEILVDGTHVRPSAPPPTLGGSSRLYTRSLKTSTPLEPGPPRLVRPEEHRVE